MNIPAVFVMIAGLLLITLGVTGAYQNFIGYKGS